MINYNQLTIKQFLKCKMIADTETDPVLRNLKLLAEIENTTLDAVESLPIGEVVKKLEGLSNIETLQQDAKIKLKFSIGGKKYIIKWKEQDLTSAQYIDVSHFCKEPEKIIFNIHNILASLAVERTWYGKELKYDGSKHKERANLFYNDMKIETAYPIMLFFCRYYKELIENILTYLEGEALVAMKKVSDFMKSGDGLQPSTA